MATFVDIKTRALRRLIDAPAAVTTEVGTLVNEAIRSLEQRHDFKVLETETAQTSTAEDTRILLAVPAATYKKPRGDPYMVRFDGSTKPLTLSQDRASVLTAYDLAGTLDKGEPEVILDTEPDDTGARNFEVYPLPDALSDWSDGNYRVVIPYWRLLPDLSGDTDTNWFTVNAVEYIIARAVAEGFLLDWDEERSTVWETKAAKWVTEAVRADKLYRLGAMRTLVPHKDVNHERLER